jgi:hypothetical protein
MSPDPTKSPGFLLGQLHQKVDFLVQAEKARQEADGLMEARITSLEQTRFRVFTIATTIGGAAGLLFSNLKDGLEWLKNSMSG